MVFELLFRTFRLTARISKYDFWNPGKILDRHRCSENISSKKISSKKAKLFSKNFWPEIFGRENFRPKKLDFEILGFWTFRNFEILENFRIFWKLRKKFQNHIFEFSPGLKVSSRQYYWRWKQRLWCRHDSGSCNFRICDPSRRKIRSLPCTQTSPWGVRRLVYL